MPDQITNANLPPTIRGSVVTLLKAENIDIEEAASKLGISQYRVQKIWEKNAEVELAARFLNELGVRVSEVLTLKEFLGIDRDPATNRDLDDMSPDVVARTDLVSIGIELTAYIDDESHARLSAIMYDVSERLRKEIAADYPDLQDLML